MAYKKGPAGKKGGDIGELKGDRSRFGRSTAC